MAIVALWASVLIPMWLRRHDDDQARRIERHRVAMGTLARMSDSEQGAHAVAARRRRLTVAGAATVGALGTAAWVAGVVPGVVALVLWLPLIAYVPVAVIAERRLARRAADAALEQRRDMRERRAQARRASSTPPPHVSSPVPAHGPTARRAEPAWDDVFDQTA